MPHRSVLFIAYNFPPAGGPGVQRSLKFVKYLPHFDWQPVIITVPPQTHPVQDASLLADVPADTPIYRAPSFDIRQFRPQANRLRLGRALALARMALALPDSALFWPLLARRSVRQAIDAHRPLAVYSSSGPRSAHLLALWVKRSYGLPWVADFRDPWSTSQFIRYPPGYRALNRRFLERPVLREADCLVTISRPLADNLQLLAGPGRPPVLVIENGYDEDDVPRLPPPKTARFTVTYTGSFGRRRRPDAFVAAVDQLVDRGRIPLEKIRVIMAGKEMARYVPDRPPFELPGYVSHDALVDLRRESDLMLLVQNDAAENRGAYSGKVFEYLACNRPTLAITNPSSVAASLIRRAQAGTVCGHEPEEIADAILGYYREWLAGDCSYAPDWIVISGYHRRALTGRLADALNQLVSSG